MSDVPLKIRKDPSLSLSPAMFQDIVLFRCLIIIAPSFTLRFTGLLESSESLTQTRGAAQLEL